MLNDQDIEKLKLVFGTKSDFDVLTKKTDNIEKLVEVIATNVFKLTEDMTEVKKDIVDIKIDLHDLHAEFKSFKIDTNDSIAKTEEDTADLKDTDIHYDKRLEKLENKVFV